MNRLNFFILYSALLLVLGSCSPKDPSLDGNAPPRSTQCWKSPIKTPPCRVVISQEQELQEAQLSLQQGEVLVADLMNMALQNNPTTKASWADARASAYGVGMAKSTLYPEITVSEAWSYTNNGLDNGIDSFGQGTSNTSGGGSGGGFSSILPGAQTSLTSDLSISYLLLDFGGRQASIKAAKQALYNSNWTHNRQVQQVMIDVLEAYYHYAGVAALLEARFDDLKNSQANFDAADHQFGAGVKNKLDVLQARTNLINLQIEIIRLQGEKEVAYGKLANVLGFPADVKFPIPDLAEEVGTDVIQEDVECFVQQAWENRPDLAAAYAQYQQAQEGIVTARSAGLPTLGTQVNLEKYNDFKNSRFNGHSVSGSVIVSVPIFSGFLYANQEKQAKEQARAAKDQLRDLELDVSLDVIKSYYNFKTSVKGLKYALDNLKNSEEAYQAAYETYNEGISTILDLLLAQQNLSESRAQVIQARTAWAIALSNISFAVGTIGTGEEIKSWEVRNND